MAYIIVNSKPYYTTGSKVFACSISANEIKVDFESPIKIEDKVECVYTENEIKQRLGIKLIDSWDENEQKVVKKSNITVSSLQLDEEELEKIEKAKAEEETRLKLEAEEKAKVEEEAKTQVKTPKK